jgi:hypothetical protein
VISNNLANIECKLGSEIKILLLILIGIFYFFSSLYKKAKQKQEEYNRNKRPVDRRNAEDIFRELQKSLHLPSTTGPEPKTQTKPAPRVAMSKEPMLAKKFRPSMENRNTSVNTSKKEASRKTEKKVRQETVPTMAESLDFDPRKAVIFSEILKRPQY